MNVCLYDGEENLFFSDERGSEPPEKEPPPPPANGDYKFANASLLTLTITLTEMTEQSLQQVAKCISKF